MASRIDPTLHRQIAAFGAPGVGACMSCGHCTAACSLATESEAFPRGIVHLIQVGHRERLARSLEPWLCYYCGECSESCPRDANPAEIMMAARRYLISVYDWTGLGRLFYRSAAWEIGAMAFIAAVVVALFALLHGPAVQTRTALNVFAPVRVIETIDWIAGGVLAMLLLSNAWRMWRLVMGTTKPPLRLLAGEARTFAEHFFTQKRWRGCRDDRGRWLKHLLLVSGYLIMMGLVIVGLRWFQTDEVRSWLHPTRLLGYYATAVLLYATGDFLIARLRARDAPAEFSEPSDWLFAGMLLMAALTGILAHILRLAGAPMATYIAYVAHLAVVAPLLIVEVPFGKWSHMLYRPLAIYLAAVRKKTFEREAAAQDAAA
jgi:ferredoxin